MVGYNLWWLWLNPKIKIKSTFSYTKIVDRFCHQEIFRVVQQNNELVAVFYIIFYILYVIIDVYNNLIFYHRLCLRTSITNKINIVMTKQTIHFIGLAFFCAFSARSNCVIPVLVLSTTASIL
ncbi:MAG: hypothetical protein ACI90V_010333 [Bacillariaceae sp.]